MPSTTVTIQGLAELNALLSGLPMAIQRIFQRVGSWYAKAVYDEANSRVPVRTGRLKRSIGQTLSMVEIRIFATAPYAAFVNFGTYRMPARPFLTEPAERLEDKFVNDLADGILNYFRSGSVA
jgi:HK97 gp10 family phage protein